MNIVEILEKNPLTAEIIRDFYMDKLLTSVKGNTEVPENFRNYVLEQKVDNNRLKIFIEANPRGLFDIFDDHDVIIETIVYPDKTFSIKIGQQATTLSWAKRKLAEEFAIETAFEILEQKLTLNN